LTTHGPLFVFADDGTPWRWKGWTSFFLYKLYLEGKDIRPLLQEAADAGANVVRVFGMSRYMDGGVIDTPPGYTGRLEDLPQDPNKQFWPQNYGAAYYDDIEPFFDLCASFGLRVEFVVFADAQAIMPDPFDQQTHLDMVVEILRELPNAFLEVCNEAHLGNGVDVSQIQPDDPEDLLWATGDYDVERIDRPDGHGDWILDPRPDMPVGRYVTYHGARSAMWPSEAPKEGHFYYDGWETINHDGNRSRGQACGVPCVNDETKAASHVGANRWGDERYTDWREAEEAGAGFALSSAGGTFHSENGCLSKPLTDTELACGKAMLAAMDFYPADATNVSYEHDRTPGHVLLNVPQLGPETWAAGESVSRTHGTTAWALTTQMVDGFVPEAKHDWRVVATSGHAGGAMKLERL
jgi:hypothetical protein